MLNVVYEKKLMLVDFHAAFPVFPFLRRVSLVVRFPFSTRSHLLKKLVYLSVHLSPTKIGLRIQKVAVSLL